ncbi:MAG TPA: hypothetical protein PLW68_03295 [Casimicrobiaceae bacterium]|nr:hypothetical protein [Casimicrobiaceae bacterium]
MLRTVATLLACLPGIAWCALPAPDGRWEGSVAIPGRQLQLVVDLAQDKGGAWTGSIIIPGLGINGTPLAKIVVIGPDATFDIVNALSNPTYGPASFSVHRVEESTMTGEMRQAGNVAKVSLHRTGAAQVELPVRSTPVAPELASEWQGEFELGGYPRKVTITLENQADAGATARFVVVGKQTTNLPVDLVLQDGAQLRIESKATQVVFEGRLVNESAELRGTIELGSLELPLTLRRAGRGN